MGDPIGIFDEGFLASLEISVKIHHQLYPAVPPQGIYFEALVESSFRAIKKPFTIVKGTNRNLAGHDLLVEDKKISLKTETGTSTSKNRITITKLCTTEREPWDASTLVSRALEHLNRYDIILMLRAVWEKPIIHYQLLEIPIDSLRLIGIADVQLVGKRKGRQSLGADVLVNGQVLFHVHFDASDGKCSIRNLPVSDCVMLREWDVMSVG